MSPPKPKRRTPESFILTPWTGARISEQELQVALSRAVSVEGKNVAISPATANLYTYYLRDLIPHASSVAALARALTAPTATGLKPAKHVLSTRRVAWQRFLATRTHTSWEKHAWPPVPAVTRTPRASTNSTFPSWWVSRSLGIGLRWLHARAQALDLPLRPRDFRTVTVASLRTGRDGKRSLIVQRAMGLGKTSGEPEVVFPLERADLLVIAAMLHASWGTDAAKLPPEQRYLLVRRGEPLTPIRMGELYGRAQARLFDTEPLCGGAARADAIDYATEAASLPTSPDRGTPLDLWGSALTVVLSRVAIRAEEVEGTSGERTPALRFDRDRTLDILQAFELVDRVNLTSRTRDQVDDPFDPHTIDTLVTASNDVLDGVQTKRQRALQERTNAWRRQRETVVKLPETVKLLPGGELREEADSDAAEMRESSGSADAASTVASTAPPRSVFLNTLVTKRFEDYTPFSKAERGTVK